jgi:hypothetical protein
MKEVEVHQKYPRNHLAQTQTGEDGYPHYKMRKAADGGVKTKIKIKTVQLPPGG